MLVRFFDHPSKQIRSVLFQKMKNLNPMKVFLSLALATGCATVKKHEYKAPSQKRFYQCLFTFAAILSFSSISMAESCRQFRCVYEDNVSRCFYAVVSCPVKPVKCTFADVPEKVLHEAYVNFIVGEDNSANNWVIAGNRYAQWQSCAGFPTFEIGKDRVRGLHMFDYLKWEDVSEQELNSAYSDFQIGKENSPTIWARAAMRYARTKGYMGGIPTFEIGANGVRGVHLIPQGSVKFFDVSENDLHGVESRFLIGEENSFEIWVRAANRLANKKGCQAGVPNFEIGENRVRGIFCMR